MNLDHIQANHIYPTLDNLSTDKDCANDCRLCIGITDVFELQKMYNWPPETKQYKKEDWKDRSRVINIPKNTLFGPRLTTTDAMKFVGFKAKSSTFYKL
jgi:hypothetical protein